MKASIRLFSLFLFVLLLLQRIFSQEENLQINWTRAFESDPKAESSLFAAKYVPYAPCECDLTTKSCDLQCCCDKDCPEKTKSAIFDCSDVDNTPIFATLPCENLPDIFKRDELFLFLCMQTEHTPYLGDFYPDRKIYSDDDYKKPKERSISEHSFDHCEFSSSDCLKKMQTTSYAVGTPVRTEITNLNSVGYFSIPTESLGSELCSWKDPLRFLETVSSACLTEITKSSCEKEPMLNAKFYQRPQEEFCLQNCPPTIIANLTSKSKLDAKKIDIKYIVKVPNQPQFSNDRSFYWFRKTSLVENIESRHKNYELEPQKTIPADPTFERLADGRFVCKNAVKQVEYAITWNGSTIQGLTAYVTIEDIEMTSKENSTLYRQTFFVNWEHINPKDPKSLSVLRSGNPGYEIGSQLITAAMENGQLKNTYNEIRIPKPDISGLCELASLYNSTFRHDTDSSCFLQLVRENFTDCAALREGVLNGMNNFFKTTHISKYGSPEGINLKKFVTVLRQNLTAYFSDDPANFTKSSYYECANISNRITLEIMFSESIRQDRLSVFEIVGAYVSFNFTTWRYSKIVAPTQKFPVSFSVRFLEKPPDPPEPVKSYYLREHRDHCPSAVTCWDELFFPFLEINIGTMDHTYSIVMAFVTLLVCASTYAVTRPWW